MRKNFTALLIILIAVFGSKVTEASTIEYNSLIKDFHAYQNDSSYTCPMHPEIISDKPGNCPKCGMKLIAVKKKVTSPPKTAPSIKKAKSVKKTNMSPDIYTCPMHPEIKSNKPGKCPVCGMDLIKTKKGDTNKMQTPVDTILTPDSTILHDHRQDKQKDDTTSQILNIEKTDNPFGKINTTSSKLPPRVVRYDLHIKDTIVTYGNKPKRAIAVNGQIPMPTLTFTEGDTAEIWVHNELKEETSFHWHGLFLPNGMDGVPYLTQMPIKPGSTYLYKFPIVQHGTHWYHSHSKLQEQIGMYGAFIMNKREEWDIPTVSVVISEWTDMKPEEVHRSLKSATDWFAIKKGSTQSYSEAIRAGHFGTKLVNEWKRMNAMDVSDVYYETFLINGKNQFEQPQFKSGDKVRLRIANAGASDYFWLTYSGGKIIVVASDGNDVVPVEVDRLLIAVSETYDVVVSVPENKSYEFLVTPEDRTKSASLWLGTGEKVKAAQLPKLKYFPGMKMMNNMMDMKGNIIEVEGMTMQNQVMDMNSVMYPEITGEEVVDNNSIHDHDSHNTASEITTLNYNMLRALQETTLPAGAVREFNFELTGNMNRYVWSLDNKVISETDKILIKKGENIRIIMYNNSMMRHPMHLHGHDFRVLNSHGEFAPMKNVIDIMPMERDTIEFAATEPRGDWFFHCHILYHMMSGMGRVFSYENAPAKTDITSAKVAKRGLNSDDRRFHFMGRIGIESNGSDGELMLGQTRWKLNTIWHLGYHDSHGYESETTFGRYLGRMQWWYPFIGFDYHYKKVGPHHSEVFSTNGSPKNIFGSEDKNMFGQNINKNHRHTPIAGVSYTLPMLFVAELRVDGLGKIRLQLGREDIPVSKRLRFNIMVNSDKEYMSGFRYILTKYFSASTHYDSDMGLGAGVTITY